MAFRNIFSWVLSVILVLTVSSVQAAEVSAERAKEIAQQWFDHLASEDSLSSTTFGEEKLPTPMHLGRLYVVSFESGGFVIVPDDDHTRPVLGYSRSATTPDPSLHPAVAGWLLGYSEFIERAAKREVTPEIQQQWQQFEERELPSRRDFDAVAPLVSTTWNQDWPYNELCPLDSRAPYYAGGHAFAGCTATAMAQVMKYYNYPSQGVGAYGYTPQDNPQYGEQTANFGGTTYQWSSMPNSISLSNLSVATLIYHCGVSVDMDYGPDGSGASTWDAMNSLVTYFKYSNSIQEFSKSQFSVTDWNDLLKNELNNNRPMIYSGRNQYGHSFVCDGYQYNDYFHMNWGWGGHYDGYFSLDDLTPDDDDFSYYQQAVVHILPETYCQCYSGECCEACTYQNTNAVCNDQVEAEYKCGSNCGAVASVRKKIRYCAGNTANCTGREEWKDWEVLDNCMASEICRTDSTTYAECVACPYGCQGGECCECSDGPCCDGCHFIDDSVLCDEPSGTEYRCDGPACGGNPQSRNQYRYCSGTSAQCDGETGWEAWETLDTCTTSATCISDGDTYAQCEVCDMGCVDGKCRECTDGTCCDGNFFLTSDAICEDNMDVEYRCDSTDCGAQGQSRKKVRFCTGESATCEAEPQWTDWQIISACTEDQLCDSDGETYATCETCEEGCQSGQCCQCRSGVCCNGCTFRGESVVCDDSGEQEYRCSGEVCGAEPQMRESQKMCSGTSATCDGENIWTPWRGIDTCSAEEFCNTDGESFARCFFCEKGCEDGQCCQCTGGDCCDGCQYYEADHLCRQSEEKEYRCNGDFCGNTVESRSMGTYCSGRSSECNGAEVALAWAVEETCATSEICTTGEEEPTCEIPADGCPFHPNCACASGACCDGCNYLESATVCNADYVHTMRCTEDDSAVEQKTQQRFCSGRSDKCDGTVDEGEWKVVETCDPGERCGTEDGLVFKCLPGGGGSGCRSVEISGTLWLFVALWPVFFLYRRFRIVKSHVNV